MTRRSKTILRALGWVVGIGLCTWHYLGDGIRKMWPANIRPNYDQVFYIRRAEEIGRYGKPRRIQRSRMPLYPWLLSFFYERGRSETEHFLRYKNVNVAISIVVLLGMLAVARWTLGTALAVPMILGAAFTFIVFKAVLVQPELIFYFLYFLAFVLMVRCLRKPDWRAGLGVGAVVGLVHLTKGSALPMLAAFLAVSTLASLAQWWLRRRPRGDITPAAATGQMRWVPLACLAGFLAVTVQLFWNSYKEFGRPLYDPNTNTIFWAENPTEMEALQAIGLADSHPAIDAEILSSPAVQEFLPRWVRDPELLAEINNRVAAGERVPLEGRFDVLPSARRYFREHSPADAAVRIASGVQRVLHRNFLHRNGYGAHLAVWLGTACIIGLLAVIFLPQRVSRELAVSKYAIAFIVLNLVGNLLLYGWWAHVSDRNRFFLTQFLPLLCSCGWVVRFAARALPWRCSVRLPDRLGGQLLTLTPWHVVVIALWAFAIEDVWDLDAGPKQLPQ